MLFEQYKEFDYERKKLEIQQENYTPKQLFLNAYSIQLKFSDVMPYLMDEDRKIKTSIIQMIVQYCVGMAHDWRIDVKYYENHQEKHIQDPSTEFTHTFYFLQYLDEWCLCIYSQESQTIYNYSLSKSAQNRFLKVFQDKKLKVEQIIKIERPMTIAEVDTIIMIKLLYTICKEKTLKIDLDPNLADDWAKQIRIVDLFLFELHKKYVEQVNKSQSLKIEKSKSIIEFKPNQSQIGEAPSRQQRKLEPIVDKPSFEQSLSQSAHQHGQIDTELIEFTKDEFLTLIDKFKSEVIAELQQIKPEHPTEFMRKYLKGNGELKIMKDNRGKEQLVVNMKGEQLQILMQQYEKYYQQKINEQEYEKQKAEAEQQYKTFLQFQQLLNYYYQYDPNKYQNLVNEYYTRLNQQTLKKLGIKQDNLQVNQSQNLNFNQSSNYLSPQQISLNKSTDRYQKKLNTVESQPSFNVSRIQNLSSQNKHQISSSFAVNPEFQPTPNNQVIAHRYQKSITQVELHQLQQQGLMTENMLNFYIRYLQEKQTYQKENTLKQLRNRIFYLSTTFYRALVKEYNNPDQISYQSASFYTQQYIGKDNTIFDKFDIILIPIIIAKGGETILININLAQQIIIFYDTILNGIGSQSMAQTQIAQTGLLNNPFLMCCLRFLEMEHNQKLMKPLSLLKWQIYYSPHEKLSDTKQTNIVTSLLITQITKGIQIDKNFTIQLELAKFLSNLVKLFKMIGITQNRNNELLFEQLPL